MRLDIWRYLMPELRDEDEQSQETYGSRIISSPRLGNRFAILRTSVALKNEIQAELYRSCILRISIRPKRRGWEAEDLPGSAMVDFRNTDFNRFKLIGIEIFCFERDDPGQLLYARASMLNFVRVLSEKREAMEDCEPYCTIDDQEVLEPWKDAWTKKRPKTCPKIPQLHIEFLNTGINKWQDLPLVKTASDIYHRLELLISPFAYLRNVEQISFTFPEEFEPDTRLLKMAHLVQRGAMTHRFRYDDWMFDHVVEEARRWLGLDLGLDTTPGPTAAILRRERLIHWPWYDKIVERLVEQQEKMEYSVNFGHPTAGRDILVRRLDPSLDKQSWKLHKTRDPNWLEQWRSFWPQGIPIAFSPEWFALMSEASHWVGDRPSHVLFT